MPLQIDRGALFQQLRQHEGLRHFPYLDTTGHETIGIGHNLTINGLSLAAIEQILYDDVEPLLDQIAQQLPWVMQLSEPRQRAIVDMAFNLGLHGLQADLPDVLAEMQKGCFDCAAKRLLSSHYAAEVKTRAVDLAAQIVKG